MRVIIKIVFLIILIIGLLATNASTGEQPVSPRLLIVGTKEVPPFAMKTDEGEWTGISINLWRQIASELNLRFTFRELDLRGLIDGIADRSLDVSVAALTLTPEREKILDFTHPFYSTGLGIAIPSRHRSPWLPVLKRFFSLAFLKVLATLTLLLLGVGALVWWFERKRNPQQFNGDAASGIASGFWWSAVTMTTVGYGDKAPVTPAGRAVALIWMFAAIIIISTFTAAITSALTVTQLKSPVQGPEDLPKVRVGTVADTTSEAHLQESHLSFTSYKTAPEGLRAIAAGKIQALVYDAPILRYLINKKFKGELEVLPKTFLRQDYGIALQAGSPLREPINRILLQKIREPWWHDMLYEYLGR
ncbi:MAG: transporter substrate-binding domain-containing protein [Deltaproteobacteria bacterium]|nr:MAG: transporter substrate-binding domain-containing protein [Deltaproteobacteria bacterium]